MNTPHTIFARDLGEVEQFLRLRPRACVRCDDSSELSCPTCAEGESCQYTVPVSECDQCPQAICMANDEPPPPPNSKDSDDDGGSGPNIGAIAGGVIGGLIVLTLAVYLAWRFLIKPKRADRGQSMYDAEVSQGMGSEKDGASRITRPPSTHTVHSIASTVLTRASNIIQIAYIPGVTNRATPNSPGLQVPPVPPIPMEHGGSHDSQSQHFFVPGDLRDSTYSGISGYSDRTSYARTSYAPRSSIASTIYGKQAQVMTGTQAGGMRLKPTMVSVKSGGSDGSMPPVPDIDFDRFGNGRPKSGASTFSVGSTFLNNANTGTATQARAQVVKAGGLKKIEINSKSSTPSLNSSKSPESTERMGNDPATAASEMAVPTVKVEGESPFSDPPELSNKKSASTPTLGAVEEADAEDEERADARSGRPGSRQRGTSPFGDEHATK
ncbi:hypothetical protein N3K66_004621 [Trichothecium roseum]|uniref:Uncharacterized protein n=1 Tax=Trichothecium roseum TaxID=47278 RepID=A0ACC0V1S9_9HYPO|nr:hypothetical protein N3K66_004621 [Trichothecium roseum]